MTHEKQPRKSQKFFKRWYPGVNTRVTLPFLVVVLVVAGIAIYVITRLVAGTIEERLSNQLVDSAQAVTNTLVEVERQYLATLRAMVYTEGVATSISNQDLAMLDRLLSSVAANDNVDELLIFDANGNNIFRLSRTLDAGTNLLDIAQWQSVLNVRNGYSDQHGDKFIEIQNINEIPMIFFTGAVTTEEGAYVGGVAIGVTVRHMLRILNEQALSAVTIYDINGDVIDSTFRSGVREGLGLEQSVINDFMTTIDDDSAPLWEFIIDGTPYQFLYAPFELRSERVGLFGVALPIGFVNDRISTSRNTFVLIFGVLFVTVGGLGVVVARSIIRPVFRMVETTRAIRGGDLSRRVDLRLPDEFGELSESFDHMTGQLIQRNREVNQLYMEQLEETARRDAVLTSISDAVIVLDNTGSPILTNDAALRLIAMVRSDREAHRRFINLSGNPQRLRQPQTITLGEQYFSVLGTPVNLKSGDSLGHVVVFRDITDIIRAEQLKDEMILQLSHELRTPLTAARGYVELTSMLHHDSLDEQGNNFLFQSVEQLAILGDMINQVVDVSAILAGKFELERRQVDLTELLQNVIEEHRYRAENENIKVIAYLPDEELWVTGDAIRLSDSIGHVLKNAYSYTLSGGWVEVRLENRNGSTAILTIEDNGVGIDKDEQDMVFERMYRGRSAEAGVTDTRGLGLGLYFFKQIIEGHGGIINLDSELNVGTRVTLQLPLIQRTTAHDDDTIPRRTDVTKQEKIYS